MATSQPCYSGGAFSWRVTTLSVLTGVGVGYLVGLITTKWLLKGQGAGGRRRPVVSGGEQQESPGNAASDLVAALTSLTMELSSLRTALSTLLSQPSRHSRRHHHSGAPSTIESEYVSARMGSSDDEFYDLE